MWYMPKHQQHDYYQYNFRLNKGDTVVLDVAENVNGASNALTWVSSSATILASGAEALAATAAIATGAAFLAF